MDQGPLVTEQIDAGARFLADFSKYVPVQAAFWLKDSEEGRWNLYVASDRITDDNFDRAYDEVARITDELQDPNFNPFQVKLIGAEDRLAKAAVEIQRRFPGKVPPRLRGEIFGGMSVDEVYFYPSPLPAAVP
jgi:hypothetical protein